MKELIELLKKGYEIEFRPQPELDFFRISIQKKVKGRVVRNDFAISFVEAESSIGVVLKGMDSEIIDLLKQQP